MTAFSSRTAISDGHAGGVACLFFSSCFSLGQVVPDRQDGVGDGEHRVQDTRVTPAPDSLATSSK